MTLAQLLSELLRISDCRQTDYAIVMHYSPSEISKYVTGTRIPPMHLIDSFIQKSAEYFGDVLWGEGKAGLLVQIFPVFSMPEERERLLSFLRHALRCAYEKSLAMSDEHVLSSSRFNMVLHGHDEIQDHVLIMLSCMFREETGRISVWLPYSFMRYLHCPAMPIRRDDSGCTIVMNLMLHHDDRISIEELMMLTRRWQNASGVLEIALWNCESLPPQPFYFKEDDFLILVNNAMPDYPIALRVLRPDVLLSFLAQRTIQRKTRASFSLDRPEEAKAAHELLMAKLPSARGAYMSTNTVFLSTGEMQNGSVNQQEMSLAMQQTFAQVIEHGLRVVVSSEAVGQFARDRGFHIPFWGKVTMDDQSMQDFLYMLADSQVLRQNGTVILTNFSLPGLSVLFFEDEMLIHSAAVHEQSEQLMLIPNELVAETLEIFKDTVKTQGAVLSMDKLMSIIRSHINFERM